MHSPSGSETLPSPKQAGVSLHISSLPGPYGIGELGENAFRFVDTLEHIGIGVWQFLPTGPTAYGDSPYQPLSSFAGNENLISIGALIEHGLIRPEEAVSLQGLSAGSVDYGTLIPLKRRLLSIAVERFESTANSAALADFDTFLQQHDADWLHDYALFRILKTEHLERPWNAWAEQFRQRDSGALRALARSHANSVQHIKIMQFLFFRQWSELRDYANERGIALFGDMPIYIALDSSDAWANRELLRIDENGRPDAVAGVPPDYFSADGQLWGNPLYAWDTHARNGFNWWIERIQAALSLSNIVRIDHFRGFESYWSVPATETTARNGAWEPGPGDALFNAIKDSLGVLPIVAEDLGVITPEVEALRDRHAIPGMRVLQFDVTDDDFEASAIRENSVCYTGTHDNDTTQGWFHGSPGDMREPDEIAETQRKTLEVTNGTPETIHTDMVRTAFATPAKLAVAPMQDYLGLGSEARMNIPGTSADNWRWRLLDSHLSREVCDNIGELISAAGRSIR